MYSAASRPPRVAGARPSSRSLARKRKCASIAAVSTGMGDGGRPGVPGPPPRGLGGVGGAQGGSPPKGLDVFGGPPLLAEKYGPASQRGAPCHVEHPAVPGGDT